MTPDPDPTTACVDIRPVSVGVPVVGWHESDQTWHQARQKGIGGSDVATVLGLNPHKTAYMLWLEKTSRRVPDPAGEAANLGHELEPWLLHQAGRMLGQPVNRPPARLYRHMDHEWRLCSPDGISGTDLVEAKTAGLLSGRSGGWGETSIPLGVELQVRWQMHVMGVPTVHVVALVAGLGLRMWSLHRHAGTEADLIDQVESWWSTHIVRDVEPPASGMDRPLLLQEHPTGGAGNVVLDETALADLEDYRAASHRQKVAEQDKEAAAARLTQHLGDHDRGVSPGGEVLCSWTRRRGNVRWSDVARDFAEAAGVDLPEVDDLPRSPETRFLTVREPK